jgi:CO/xanthine dehydrogenase FAD-binding subunit
VTVATYFQPTSLGEALGLLREHGPELLVMAGGTVAMPLVNEGISLPSMVMGLRRAGLDGLAAGADGSLRIGATTTLTALADQAAVPLLASAARRTAAWAVRNMATVGGNLFTPPPGGDLATALLALDARVVVAGPGGERLVDLEDFWTGFMTTVVALDELVVAVVVPPAAPAPGEERTAFEKLGRKAANTPAVVTVAARARVDADGIARGVRLALGAVGPHPLRARGAEAVLEETRIDASTIARAAAAATEAVEPVTDAVASDWYRRRMTGVVTTRVLQRLADNVEGGA